METTILIIRANRRKLMRRTKTLALSLSTVLLASCGLMKGLEHDLTIAIRHNGDLYFSGIVNEFNNIIMPQMDPAFIAPGMKFAGYTLDIGWNIEKGLDALYKEGELVRYQNVKQYAYNGGVEFFSQFVTSTTPLSLQHYLKLGWYNKPATSGLNETIIGKLSSQLNEYLASKGASEEELADFVVKGYEGNVGSIGSQINEDDNVDVFIGAAANLLSTGGVEYVEREAAGKNYGGVSGRYVYLLHDKPASRLLYEYCLSDAFYTIFE